MQTYDLGAEQVDYILTLEEGHFLDFKALEIAPKKLSQSLSAFSSADGGELYVGVDEASNGSGRVWRGFEDVEAANGHIQALEEVFPLGADVEYEFLRA